MATRKHTFGNVVVGEYLLFTRYSYPHSEDVVWVESVSDKSFQTNNGYHFSKTTGLCVGRDDAKVEKFDAEKAACIRRRNDRREKEIEMLRFFSNQKNITDMPDGAFLELYGMINTQK